MRLLLKTKYLVRKVNIVPVKIDFPLPTKVQGAEQRLNPANDYSLPETIFKKHQPNHLVGKTLRLAHLL